MAVNAKSRKLPANFQVRVHASRHGCFCGLPWRSGVGSGQLLGIRSDDLPIETRDQLKLWVARQLLGNDAEEMPVSCKLTDLSLSACYLQTDSPFPVRTRLQLIMKVGELTVETEGIVRLTHPGKPAWSGVHEEYVFAEGPRGRLFARWLARRGVPISKSSRTH